MSSRTHWATGSASMMLSIALRRLTQYEFSKVPSGQQAVSQAESIKGGFVTADPATWTLVARALEFDVAQSEVIGLGDEVNWLIDDSCGQTISGSS